MSDEAYKEARLERLVAKCRELGVRRLVFDGIEIELATVAREQPLGVPAGGSDPFPVDRSQMIDALKSANIPDALRRYAQEQLFDEDISATFTNPAEGK